MKKRVEELLKKAKTITPKTEHLFESEVYDEYRNERITSYDRFFLLQAADYFSKGTFRIEPSRISWAQGYIRKKDDGIIEYYAGRLGYGYIKHIRSEKSTRYHLIEYHIVTY